MDSWRAVAELKNLFDDYGMVLPYDPYHTLNVEEALERFLDRYFTEVYGVGYDEGFASGCALYDENYD
jgi:hypothetical protein